MERCDKLRPLAVGHDFEALSVSLVGLDAYARETAARIETATVELDFLEKNNLSVGEYLDTLRNQETGFVMIPVEASQGAGGDTHS